MTGARVCLLGVFAATAACGFLLPDSKDGDPPAPDLEDATAETGVDPPVGDGGVDPDGGFDLGDAGHDATFEAGFDASVPARLVFVTAISSTGALGGKSLTDLETDCAHAASNAGWGGGRTFTPFLYYSSGISPSPLDRLSTGDPWFTSVGDKVSDGNPKTLLSGLAHAIDHNADGTLVTGPVWTGAPSLSTPGAPNCQSWTTGSGKMGSIGSANASSTQAFYVTEVPCETPAHVYCFEK